MEAMPMDATPSSPKPTGHKRKMVHDADTKTDDQRPDANETITLALTDHGNGVSDDWFRMSLVKFGVKPPARYKTTFFEWFRIIIGGMYRGVIEHRTKARPHPEGVELPEGAKECLQFPMAIPVKNNATNRKRANVIRKCIQSGRTARTFLVSTTTRGSDIVVAFGRSEKEDQEVFLNEQKRMEVVEMASESRALEFGIRDGSITNVSVQVFEARLRPDKVQAWQDFKQKAIDKAVRDAMRAFLNTESVHYFDLSFEK